MAFRPPECANEQMPRLLDAKNAAAACIARRPGFAVVAGVCRVNFPTTDRIFVAKGGLSSACDRACLGLSSNTQLSLTPDRRYCPTLSQRSSDA
jgi:hypothetical protein